MRLIESVVSCFVGSKCVRVLVGTVAEVRIVRESKAHIEARDLYYRLSIACGLPALEELA